MWLAQGNPASTSVTMEGVAVAMVNGYPSVAGIDDTLVEYQGFLLTTPGGTARFTKATPQTPPQPIANCYVTYTPAPANGSPSVVVTSGSC
jgi:hypothetical protein